MKAILVVDIPEDYTGSVISVNLYGRNNKLIHENHINKLRPLPQRKEREPWASNEFAVYNNLYKLGWNDCLKEIAEKTECTTQKKDT